jgi:hypothetical protein
MMDVINSLPPFWQGVLSSIVAALVLAVLGFVLRIVFSSIREWVSTRRGSLEILRQQLSSAMPAVRGEATIRVLFSVAQWLIISAILYTLSSVLSFSGYRFVDLTLKLASLGSLVIGLWWLFQYQRPGKSVSDDWKEVLLTGKWILVFNPPNRMKPISFLPNGLVGLGQNNNEHAWRINAGKLELVQNDGRVHSRFHFYPRNSSFLHTNDPDTLSIKGQYIVPATNG